jgi:hypothetical protein
VVYFYGFGRQPLTIVYALRRAPADYGIPRLDASE